MTLQANKNVDSRTNGAARSRRTADAHGARPPVPVGTSASAAETLVRQQGLSLALLAEVLDSKQFVAAASTIVTELATALGCQRVSLGTCVGDRVELAAISNNAEFKGNSNVAVALADAMAEACRQETALVFPVRDSRFMVRAHAELARVCDHPAILTIPLACDKTIGALLLERTGAEAFDEATTEFAKQVAQLLAPVLNLKINAERPLRQRLRTSIMGALSRVFEPRHLIAKATALALIALVTLTVLVDGTARVTSAATLEPSETHAVVAPVRGFIEVAHHRAGDIVTAGTRLASLDQREMRLERAKWESELGSSSRGDNIRGNFFTVSTTTNTMRAFYHEK